MKIWYIIRYIKPIKRKFYYLYHLLRYGFSPHEIWSLDREIVKFILPRLKYFRNHLNGYPGDHTEEKWNEVLDKIIWSMEYAKNDYILDSEFIDDNLDINIIKQNQTKCQEGFELFGKYFSNLWD
jgi:hypothetical protein